MPAKHAEYQGDWTPERFLRWASGVGSATQQAIGHVLASRPIVEQAFVPCMNILNLAKGGKRELLEAACADATTKGGVPTYTRIKNTMEALRTRANAAKVSAASQGTTVGTDRLGDVGCVRGPDYRKDLQGIADGGEHDN